MNIRWTAAASLALLVAACSGGSKDDRAAAQQRASAMGKDFALTKQSITMPTDETETWPAGPGDEQVDVNCRACHSPSMVLAQPPLKHDEWVKVIDKMRTVYKASINEADMPQILAYLDDFSARQSAAGQSAAPGSAANQAQAKVKNSP
jgi:cytochrome c5